jgi:uncharacterized protein (TIRG00374 family)
VHPAGAAGPSATPPASSTVRWWIVFCACAWIALFTILAAFAGAAGVFEALARISPATIGAMLALSLVNYALRAARWHLYSKRIGAVVSPRRSLLYFIAGFSMTMTPGKAGEALRLLLLSRNHGYPIGATAGLLVADRVSDAVALLLLCVAGLPLVLNQTTAVAALSALFVLPVALMVAPVAFARVVTAALSFVRAPAAALRFIDDVARQIKRLGDRRTILVATVLGVTGWAAEGAALGLALHALGYDLPLLVCTFVFSMASIIGAAILIPGGLVGAEVSMASLLVANGVGAPDAIVATVVVRLTTLWFAVLLGLAVLPRALRPQRRDADER